MSYKLPKNKTAEELIDESGYFYNQYSNLSETEKNDLKAKTIRDQTRTRKFSYNYRYSLMKERNESDYGHLHYLDVLDQERIKRGTNNIE